MAMNPLVRDGEPPRLAGSVLFVCNDTEIVPMFTQAVEQFALALDVQRGTWAPLATLAQKKYDAVIVDMQLGTWAEAILRELSSSPANHSAVTFSITAHTPEIKQGLHSDSMFVFSRPLTQASINLTLKAAFGLILRERRRYFRCPIVMDVILRPEEGQELECQTANIGEGGIALETAHAIMPGGRNTVQFTLPGQSSRLEVESLVRWRNEEGCIGLQFLALSPQQKVQLYSWLSIRFEETLPEHVAAQFRHANQP